MNWIRQRIIALGAVAGALMAIATAWGMFGFPTLATAEDLRKLTERLTRSQAEMQIEVYQRAADEALLALTDEQVRNNPVARSIVNSKISRAEAKLEEARQRLIELSR